MRVADGHDGGFEAHIPASQVIATSPCQHSTASPYFTARGFVALTSLKLGRKERDIARCAKKSSRWCPAYLVMLRRQILQLLERLVQLRLVFRVRAAAGVRQEQLRRIDLRARRQQCCLEVHTGKAKAVGH